VQVFNNKSSALRKSVQVPKIVDHDQRRSEVARLTRELISEQGLAAFSFRELAKRSGWSPSAVTHYFSTRDEMLLFTLDQIQEQLRERIERSRNQGVQPVEAILRAVLPLDTVQAQQWHVWLAFWGAAVGSPEIAQMQHQFQTDFQRAIRDALVEEHFDGDAERESLRLVALADGVSVQATFAPEQWPPEKQLAVLGFPE